MLDGYAIERYQRSVKAGRLLDAITWGALIIPWGSDCCHGCENYLPGRTITAHGYCPIHNRNVSPHFFCDQWGKD